MNESETTDGQRTRSKAIEVLRWVGVIPAAWLASWVLQGSGSFILSLGGMLDLRGPNYPAFLFPLLFYLSSGAAFSFVGAMTAPRLRIAAGVILAAFCICLSCMVHIFTQKNAGLTNYMHATGEALGAVIGVAVVACLVRRERIRTLN